MSAIFNYEVDEETPAPTAAPSRPLIHLENITKYRTGTGLFEPVRLSGAGNVSWGISKLNFEGRDKVKGVG